MKKLIYFGYVFLSINTLIAQNNVVGIGTNTPKSKLDIAGDLALREGTAIPLSGNNPAVSVSLSTTASENSFYRITGTPTGTMTLNSIANGVDGQIITLVNATAIKLKITNNNVANGILTSGGATTVIAPNGTFTLQYSSGADRWYITNAAGATVVDWIKATTTDEPALSTDNQYVTGKVGIGDFSGSTPNTALEVKSAGTGITTNWDPQTMQIYVNDTRTAAANVGGGIGFTGNYTGTTPAGFSSIWGGKENATVGNFASYLGFATRINGASVLERMRISSTGNLGIGTTDPTQRLDIKGGSILIRQGNGGGASTADQIFFGYNDGTLYRQAIRTQHHSGQGQHSGTPQNTIDFYIWNNSITSDAEPTDKVMSVTNGGVLGRFRHITHHDYYQNSYYSGNRWMWIPKPGAVDGAETVDNRDHERNMWLVPYSGRIVSITISVDNYSSNGGYEISNGRFLFAHHPDLNEYGGCGSGSNFCPVSTADAGAPGQFYVLSGNAAVNNTNGYFSINESPAGVVQWRADGSNHFSFNKGDKVAIGINPDYIEDNAYQITVVWEYNIDE